MLETYQGYIAQRKETHIKRQLSNWGTKVEEGLAKKQILREDEVNDWPKQKSPSDRKKKQVGGVTKGKHFGTKRRGTDCGGCAGGEG